MVIVSGTLIITQSTQKFYIQPKNDNVDCGVTASHRKQSTAVSRRLITESRSPSPDIQHQAQDGRTATHRKHSTAVSRRIITESRSPSPDVQHEAQDDQAELEGVEI